MVRGRADDVINTGGHKVVPGEVAAVLSTCPGVREVVVVGRPDPEWGERVTAVVVPADPADTTWPRIATYACKRAASALRLPKRGRADGGYPGASQRQTGPGSPQGGKNVTPTGTISGAER